MRQLTDNNPEIVVEIDDDAPPGDVLSTLAQLLLSLTEQDEKD